MNESKVGVRYSGTMNRSSRCLGTYESIFPPAVQTQTEGVVRAHAGRKAPSIPDCSTISRRVNKLDIKVNERVGNDIVTALDSTGINVANRAERVDAAQVACPQRLPEDTRGS